MVDQIQQFDDCFQIELPFKKINEIIFMASAHLLILHAPNQYTLIQIANRNEIITLKNGRLPNLIENVKKISDQLISFIHQNQLHVFNLFEEQSSHIYAIGRSSIYLQQFHYQTFNSDQKLFIFSKTSILKGSPVSIYYQIHLLCLKQTLQKVKRLKTHHQDLRKFGYSCGEVFSYQLSGYEIEIIFLESGITHKIQSIFNLFLIDIRFNDEEIFLNFTHDELENELSMYKVNKKKITKMNRTAKNLQKHATYNQNKLRSIVFKNGFNHRKQDPYVGIFRVKTSKESKLLHLMQNGLEEQLSNQFKQLVLNLCVE